MLKSCASTRLRFLCAVLCLAPIGLVAHAEDLTFPSEHHPWARFPVGSWKRVRTTAESLNDNGQVTSVTKTDTTTTLVDLDQTGYSLRTNATVEVASRIITAAPQTTRHGFYGEASGQPYEVRRAAAATLTIDGRAIPCDVRQVTLNGEGTKVLSTLYYSNQVSPFVLRREISVEGAAEDSRNTTLVEVVALDLPERIRGELKSSSYIKTTQKMPQSSKVTLEVHCDDVPGGVASHSASETDLNGTVLRRSTLELVDYGIAATMAVQQGVFRQPIRPKAARRMDRR